MQIAQDLFERAVEFFVGSGKAAAGGEGLFVHAVTGDDAFGFDLGGDALEQLALRDFQG